MGDVSEMMLDGTLCEGCGVYVGGTEIGAPLLCSHCAADRRALGHRITRLGAFYVDGGPAPTTRATKAAKAAAPKTKCPTCGRMVKAAGLADHARVVHADNPRSTP